MVSFSKSWTTAAIASLLWNAQSVTAQTMTPNGVPVEVIVNICRNPVTGFITFEQTGSLSLSTDSPGESTAANTPEFQKRSNEIGFLQEELDFYFVGFNFVNDCLDGASFIETPLNDPGVPSLYVTSTLFFVDRGYVSGSSVDGTADSVSQATMADIGLKQGSTCIYEYNADNNVNTGTPTNGFDAAIVWNVGHDDGTGCLIQPSSQPSETPSVTPSDSPSESQPPSNQPSNSPSESQAPSNQPSNSPSESQSPSIQPSNSTSNL